jgi:peptidoglycan/LPS O-acetylase OafA/YrhL
VFLVFVWHFAHAGAAGYPVPLGDVPFWGPLVLFDEGHVGVALFMTLSGYLFARLLESKRIRYGAFLWNRALRLFPLLLLVTTMTALQLSVSAGTARAGFGFLRALPAGFVKPIWPYGQWSIAIELHFYVMLPLILALLRRSPAWLAGLVGLAIAMRAWLFLSYGEVQFLAYWTIVGRIDQFLFGVLGYHLRSWMAGRHVRAAIVFATFVTVYYVFDASGGFYELGGYPSRSPLWIVMPTIEGAACAALIAWYDGSFTPRAAGVSRFLAWVGDCSYSMYLLHFFVVFAMADWIHTHVVDLSNFVVAFVAASVAFAMFLPCVSLSWRFIETPMLRWRRPYVGRDGR